MEKKNKRKVSLERAKKLKNRIESYNKVKKNIKTGISERESIKSRKNKILSILNGTEADWLDYKWQLRNRISDTKILSRILDLSEIQKKNIENVGKEFRWSISPYYLSLIGSADPVDPIGLMALPSIMEIEDFYGELDPMNEEYTNPAGSITRRYPDRLIINVTNECAMYCRFCQRRRNIGSEDKPTSSKLINESIKYIKNNTEIRDVLITGGDSLSLSDKKLENIISKIRAINHVEIIRLGTRTPVTMPQRITDDLCNMLKKYHPIYINTHFNSPLEITEEAKTACEKLANAGIPVGNQAVLLKGVNNDADIMKKLNQELLKIRVKPYYIFYAKNVKGTTHFCTSINEGLDIIKNLRGFTTGMAIPSFIVNAPGGKGKIHLVEDNIIELTDEYALLKTWENELVKIKNY